LYRIEVWGLSNWNMGLLSGLNGVKWRWDKIKSMEKNEEENSWLISHIDRRIRGRMVKRE
jgi:hypothetical protein